MESPVSGMLNHQQDQLRVNVFLHGLPVSSSGSSSQPSNIALQQKVKKPGNIFFIKGKLYFSLDLIGAFCRAPCLEAYFSA
jgi:hypothetical protein